MAKYLTKLLFIPAFVLATQAVADDVKTNEVESAATPSNISVEWLKPEKFRDVKHPSISRKRYRESVFLELETFFAGLGKHLPHGHSIVIQVTNLDMAGTVQTPSMAGLTSFSNSASTDMNDYRIIRAIDIPRMDFSYKLLDAKGEVIQEESVELKDMSFLSRSASVRKNVALRYEKEMISRWFKQTFPSEGR